MKRKVASKTPFTAKTATDSINKNDIAVAKIPLPAFKKRAKREKPKPFGRAKGKISKGGHQIIIRQ